MLNKWIGIGRLCADPELRYGASSGKAVATFRLAISERADHTEFLNIVVWEKQAENCAQYLKKGSMTCVVGRVVTRSYDKNGEKRYITEVVAETVRFLSPKGGTSESMTDEAKRLMGGHEVEDTDNVPF